MGGVVCTQTLLHRAAEGWRCLAVNPLPQVLGDCQIRRFAALHRNGNSLRLFLFQVFYIPTLSSIGFLGAEKGTEVVGAAGILCDNFYPPSPADAMEDVNQRFFEVVPKVVHVFCHFISVCMVLHDTIAASRIYTCLYTVTLVFTK